MMLSATVPQARSGASEVNLLIDWLIDRMVFFKGSKPDGSHLLALIAVTFWPARANVRHSFFCCIDFGAPFFCLFPILLWFGLSFWVHFDSIFRPFSLLVRRFRRFPNTYSPHTDSPVSPQGCGGLRPALTMTFGLPFDIVFSIFFKNGESVK